MTIALCIIQWSLDNGKFKHIMYFELVKKVTSNYSKDDMYQGKPWQLVSWKGIRRRYTSRLVHL